MGREGRLARKPLKEDLDGFWVAFGGELAEELLLSELLLLGHELELLASSLEGRGL